MGWCYMQTSHLRPRLEPWDAASHVSCGTVQSPPPRLPLSVQLWPALCRATSRATWVSGIRGWRMPRDRPEMCFLRLIHRAGDGAPAAQGACPTDPLPGLPTFSVSLPGSSLMPAPGYTSQVSCCRLCSQENPGWAQFQIAYGDPLTPHL